MQKNTIPTVLFNASVVLAGLKAPTGGSGELLMWCRKKRVIGIISEIIYNEVIRNTDKIRLNKKMVIRQLHKIFPYVLPPPDLTQVEDFYKAVVDVGDAHILASCLESKAEFLVTLDKKHLLTEAVKDVMRKNNVEILTPGEVLQRLLQ